MKKIFCLALIVFNLFSIPMVFADTPQANSEKQILFICTGNYYRSRFAEAVFNYYMSKKKSHWKAYSRGLNISALTPTQRKVPVSAYTVTELNKLNIPLSFVDGQPTQLVQADLDSSHYVIALSRSEHKPLLEKGFTRLSKIQYWEVEDMHLASSDQALPAILTQVQKLIQQLPEE
jgi:protein-tyrosine phosphatase